MGYMRNLSIILLFILSFNFLQAKHIIGGVMYYQYIGSPSAGMNTYKITLKVYRDCVPEPNKAGFDDPASGAIALSDGRYYNRNFDFNNPIITSLNNEITNNCQILPPGLCVEEGVYTRTVTLPVDSTRSYYIMYQRCCRNSTIFNILQPGSFGASFYVEITPQAQILKTSSPQFKSFPPIAICANYSLVYDHSGIDVDGDSLAYEFVSPLHGGGQGNFGCTSTAPSPPCLPPYSTLDFRSPFTPSIPMGGNPIVRIDPVTGIISGKPEIIGQFVVGVKMKKYRNGVLLCETLRDFQFNVTECVSAVEAKLEYKNEPIIPSVELVICGDSIINIKNASRTIPNASFEWQIDLGTDTAFYFTKDLSFPYQGTGLFKGVLIINKGLECSDTGYFNIRKFPALNGDFNYSYDSCFSNKIDFESWTNLPGEKITMWNWQANGDSIGNAKNVVYATDTSGTFALQLIMENENTCRDTINKNVEFYPVFTKLPVIPAAQIGCLPFSGSFDIPGNFPSDKYQINWAFGDGVTGKGDNITHIFTQAGQYDISVNIANNLGCSIQQSWPQFVTVHPKPISLFDFNPHQLNGKYSTINIQDQSTGAKSWLYFISNGDSLIIQSPVYDFRDTGIYTISQIVTNEFSCKDTSITTVDIAPFYTLYLPNAFTPGVDGINDVFRPSGISSGYTFYELSIFDRWGNQIFKSNEWEAGWKGIDKNGQPLPAGSYVAKVKTINGRGNSTELKNNVLLIR